MGESYSGVLPERLIDVDQATRHYGLEVRDTLFAPDLHNKLAENGIAMIEMPLSPDDFKTLLEGYEVCINEYPELLAATQHAVDLRLGNEAGHVRKERKVVSGKQYADPKNLMHFNEYARRRWGEEFSDAPKAFRDFLTAGYEVHNGLISVAKRQFEILDETHPNLLRSHFPGNLGTTHASLSFMRILRYDSYEVTEDLADVAKPHYDISGATIQAYADAPGFWGAEDGKNGERTHYDTAVDAGYFFLGAGYRKLYGNRSPLKPLYHGVDRVIPAGVTAVPERHAVILFIDAPFINYGVRASDTLPELYG